MALTSLVAANAAAAAAGAGKKAAQVQLQADLNTDDDWTKFLNREGLLVVDVYSEWCGPCIGMVGNLKKMKVELGGDNLHLAIARSDTIDCLKRFRNRSEPTWMFIAAGKLLNVVFGADAPRLARTIEQELKNEEQARKGERERPERRPDELTPHEQEAADAQEKLRQDKLAREEAAVEEARLQRREARAKRLEAHFSEVCPALMMPHSQKYLRKVADALEPLGVLVADKCPLLVGKDGAKVLAAEDETFAAPAAQTALVERPSLTLLLKKMPDKEGEVIELVRRALCGEGIEVSEGEKPKKHLVEELTADGVPGLFIPTDRHQRAVILDLLFPKMVGVLVEPPLPPEPPHVAITFGAWQRRAVLAAAAAPDTAPCVLRYGFFADASVDEPRLLAKTLEKYEERPEKDYCETLTLMVSVGSAEPRLLPAASGPPPSLVGAGALRVSADAVEGARECARYFPPGYSEPELKPKMKCKRKKKKRENKEDTIDQDPTAETTPASETAETDAGEGDAEGEMEGEGEVEGEEEEAEGEEEGGVDKATSPPPQPPPE